jgi:hypothetical protein
MGTDAMIEFVVVPLLVVIGVLLLLAMLVSGGVV